MSWCSIGLSCAQQQHTILGNERSVLLISRALPQMHPPKPPSLASACAYLYLHAHAPGAHRQLHANHG